MSDSTFFDKRSTRWVYLGLGLSLIAEQAVIFALPLIIYERTQSISASGFAFALEWMLPIFVYPFAGLLADRIGGRRLYRLANLARAFCLMIALAACYAQPAWTIPILIGNSVLLSVLIAPNRMAIQKTIALIGPDDKLAHRLSMQQNIELTSMAVGPAVAAGLALLIGKLPLFGVAGAAFFLAVVCWKNVPAGQPKQVTAGSAIPDLILGWRLLFANQAVILLAAINFSINLVFAVVLSANAYIITGAFHAPEYVMGIMSAGTGALGLVNLILVPRILKSWSIYHLGAGGFVLVCVNMLALGLARNVWVYVGAFLLAMAGVTLFNVFNRTERVLAIGKEHLGKVSGVFFMLNAFSYPLGGAVTAGLGAAYGVQNIVLGLSVLLVLAGVPMLVMAIHYFVRQKELAADALRPGPDEVANAPLASAKS